MIAVAWFLAGAGWAVALLALFLAVRFRADWADIWRTAWLLRQQGWTVPGEVEAAVTTHLSARPRRRGRGAVPPPVDPNAIELTPPITAVIAETQELWHQEELANHARQMLAGGASEAEVVNELRELLRPE